MLSFTKLLIGTLWICHSMTSLPPRRAVKKFINLTNGIEVLPRLINEGGVGFDDVSWLRIQSTHCENTNYNGIIEGLDHNFLMNAALGSVCVLYDYGSRGTGKLIGPDDHRYGIPRSYWWGLEWIRHCLSNVWHLPESEEPQRFVRGYNMKGLFDSAISAMPKTLKRKLKYYRPYLLTSQLYIYGVYGRTSEDGEKEFYHNLMRNLAATQTLVPSSCINAVPPEVPQSDEAVASWLTENRHVPRSMHIYSSSDFLGLGKHVDPVPNEK